MTPEEMEDARDVEVEVETDEETPDDYHAAINLVNDALEVFEAIQKLDKREPFMTRNMRLRIEGIVNEAYSFLGYDEKE